MTFTLKLTPKIIVCIIFILIGLTACTSIEPPPHAVAGQLDLRHWNFDLDGPILLSGEWFFYWQQFVEPSGFDTPPPPDTLITIPGHWTNLVFDDESLSGYGYGTHHLTILLPDNMTADLAIDMFEVETAYSFFINGELVGTNGVVGSTRELMKPQWLPQLLNVPANEGRLSLVVHVSNFYHRRGGIGQPLMLGTEAQILRIKERRLISTFFLFGSIMVMAFYHIGLFAVRRKDKTPLYFSLVCFFMAIRGLVIDDFYLSRILPDDSWWYIAKVTYGTIYFLPLPFMLFVSSLYPQEFSYRYRRLVMVISVGLGGLVLLTPAYIFTRTLIFYHGFVALFITYCLYVIIKAVWYRREGADIFLIGYIVLFCAIINDILNANHVIATGYYGSLGLFGFIFAQSLLISGRFSRAFSQIETLSAELEQRVVNRTAHLQSLNNQMRDELKLARDIQYSLLPPSRPAWPEFDIICYTNPASEVGGDFYSYQRLDDKRVVVALGDVSGKGVSAALLMATSLAQFDAMLHRNLSPPARMAALDEALMPYTQPRRQNCALCYIELGCAPITIEGDDLDEIPLSVVNAGCIPPYIKRHDGTVEFYEIGGFALGQGLGQLSGYQESVFGLFRGDMVILTSDGVVEAQNINGEMLGFDRLTAIIETAPTTTAEAMLNHIKEALQQFTTTAYPHDDLTIVVVQR